MSAVLTAVLKLNVYYNFFLIKLLKAVNVNASVHVPSPLQPNDFHYK